MTHAENAIGGGEGEGAASPELPQSALDAQIKYLAEMELDSLEGWYLELGSILDDVHQIRTRIQRFRNQIGNRITELEQQR